MMYVIPFYTSLIKVEGMNSGCGYKTPLLFHDTTHS